MTKRRLRKLLVLGLVLVPGAVLSVISWRLIGQERQLRDSRLGERRALAAARLGQQMLSRLDLERAGARASPHEAAFVPDSGVLVLVARVTERGMALPWDPSTGEAGTSGPSTPREGSTTPSAPAGPDYRRHIAEGERLEFERDRPDLAVDRYAAAAAVAASETARLDAHLREARALSRAGHAGAARSVYRTVADAPPDVRDRDGMPLALYGAEGLLQEAHADIGSILVVIERVVAEKDVGPPALYALRDLARRVAARTDSMRSGDALRSSSDDPVRPVEAIDPRAPNARIHALEGVVSGRIRVAERIIELRRDLPAVLSLASPRATHTVKPQAPGSDTAATEASTPAVPLPSAWRPWGPEPWLVGVGDGADRLVLVADPVRLLRAIATDAPADLGVALSEVSLSTIPGPDAELLGPTFPALFAILPAAAFGDAQSSSFGSVLLLLVLPLVLGVTALAAWLLWRDVRREIETAGMRAQFVSSVSHELKTPLTSIRMYAQTLLMGRSRTEADRRTYLETIVNESERLTRLINNVLDVSRIERNGRSYHMQPTALAEVVNGAARAMSYPLEQGGFVLDVHVEEGIPDVRCDGDALTQAVVNLLSNAVKFSGTTKSIALELVREGDRAVIRVRDHGHGIDRRHHEAIFERFFRTPEAESNGLPGTGLGLALVAHVVHAHGGVVDLDSAPGLGSTFTIRIPLTQTGTVARRADPSP